MSSFSKPLKHPDISGFEFVKDIMGDNPGAAINFDLLLKHPEHGYLLFELLLCEESQPRVTPWTSHPKNYWYKNKQKFISLWNAVQVMGGTLFLVNYAKKGTKHQDEVRLMKVTDCNEDTIKTLNYQWSRDYFAQWYRNLNKKILNG